MVSHSWAPVADQSADQPAGPSSSYIRRRSAAHGRVRTSSRTDRPASVSFSTIPTAARGDAAQMIRSGSARPAVR